jgi:hypothetical protein
VNNTAVKKDSKLRVLAFEETTLFNLRKRPSILKRKPSFSYRLEIGI